MITEVIPKIIGNLWKIQSSKMIEWKVWLSVKERLKATTISDIFVEWTDKFYLYQGKVSKFLKMIRVGIMP